MAEEKQKVSGCSYVLYYLVLFFAYWFGSSRFDVDGDGDFDPEDVQAYLADKGFLKKNFKQSKTGRAKTKKAQAQARSNTGQGSGSNAGSSGDASTVGKGLEDIDNPYGDKEMEDFMTSKVEGETAEDQMMHNLIERQQIPWFITLECLAVFCLWFVFAIKTASETGVDPLQVKAGIDSLADGQLDLRWAGPACEDYKPQIWRWLTYQWTHVGAMHVLMNVFLNIMLGIPLEGLHGSWRMALMFNVGVMGGALCYFVSDAHTAVVGCSGGCYALIGIHLADLVMNWHQKKFRVPTLVFLVILVGVDVFSYAMSLSQENSSHSAHVGGAIAGVIIGGLVCKNLKMHTHEKFLMGVFSVLGLALTGFSLYWIFSAPGGPINIFEASEGQNGYCWVRQVYLPEVDEWNWLCIRCGTQGCMDEWDKQPNLATVSILVCKDKGWYYDGR